VVSHGSGISLVIIASIANSMLAMLSTQHMMLFATKSLANFTALNSEYVTVVTMNPSFRGATPTPHLASGVTLLWLGPLALLLPR
jgi:hypothetical protein